MKLFALSLLMISVTLISMEQEKNEKTFFPEEGLEYSVEYFFEKFGGIILGFDSEDKFDEITDEKKLENCGSKIIQKKLGQKAFEFYTQKPEHAHSQYINRYTKAVVYRLMVTRPNDEQLIEAERQIPFNFRELNYIDGSNEGNKIQNSHAQQRAYLNSRLQAIKAEILAKSK